MSTIEVKRAHSLGAPEALQRAQDLVNDFAARLKADVTWTGREASFKGSGFSGSAKVTDDQISVNVDLGLLLRAMKGRIEGKLEQALVDKFA